MSNVKGTVMLTLIKGIRGNKSGIYDDKFTAADWKVLNGVIYPTGWYLFSLYKKMIRAAAEVEINNDEKKLFEWGYQGVDLLLYRLYNSFIVEGSVVATIQNYTAINRMFFDGCRIEMRQIEDKKIQLDFFGYTSDFEEFYRIVNGWIFRIVERAGAENTKSHFVSKSWEGDPDTTIEYAWD